MNRCAFSRVFVVAMAALGTALLSFGGSGDRSATIAVSPVGACGELPSPVYAPICHEPYYQGERELYGYDPMFEPNVVSFDETNRPFIRTVEEAPRVCQGGGNDGNACSTPGDCFGASCLSDPNVPDRILVQRFNESTCTWDELDFRSQTGTSAIKDAFPAWDEKTRGQLASYQVDHRVVFDSDGDAYTFVSSKLFRTVGITKCFGLCSNDETRACYLDEHCDGGVGACIGGTRLGTPCLSNDDCLGDVCYGECDGATGSARVACNRHGECSSENCSSTILDQSVLLHSRDNGESWKAYKTASVGYRFGVLEFQDAHNELSHPPSLLLYNIGGSAPESILFLAPKKNDDDTLSLDQVVTLDLQGYAPLYGQTNVIITKGDYSFVVWAGADQQAGDAVCVGASAENLGPCDGGCPPGSTCAGANICHGGLQDGAFCWNDEDCPGGTCPACLLCQGGVWDQRYACADCPGRDSVCSLVCENHSLCSIDEPCDSGNCTIFRCQGGIRDDEQCGCPRSGICEERICPGFCDSKCCRGGTEHGSACVTIDDCPDDGRCESCVCYSDGDCPRKCCENVCMGDETTDCVADADCPDGWFCSGCNSPSPGTCPAPYSTCGGVSKCSPCLTDDDCLNPVCCGGSDAGQPCSNCPGGECGSSGFCEGGDDAGVLCNCNGGTCPLPTCPRGTPQYIARYDRQLGAFSDPVLLGYGGRGALDGHSAPGITIDSNGYLHIVLGAHGRPFIYVRSSLPCTDAGWNINAPDAWTNPVRLGAEGLCGPIENKPRALGCNCDFTWNQGHALDRCGAGCEQFTYVSLACDANDVLHLVARWTGLTPGRSGLYRLVYLRATPVAGDWVWEPRRDLVLPFHAGYSIWYHKLNLDRQGRFFLFYAYYGNQLSLDEAEAYMNRWPEEVIQPYDDPPCTPTNQRITGRCRETGEQCTSNAECPGDGDECILAPNFCPGTDCSATSDCEPSAYTVCVAGKCLDYLRDANTKCWHTGVRVHDPVLLVSPDSGDTWHIATHADFESGITNPSIPTVSGWGLVVTALLLLTAGALVYTRRRAIHV